MQMPCFNVTVLTNPKVECGRYTRKPMLTIFPLQLFFTTVIATEPTTHTADADATNEIDMLLYADRHLYILFTHAIISVLLSSSLF